MDAVDGVDAENLATCIGTDKQKIGLEKKIVPQVFAWQRVKFFSRCRVVDIVDNVVDCGWCGR